MLVIFLMLHSIFEDYLGLVVNWCSVVAACLLATALCDPSVRSCCISRSSSMAEQARRRGGLLGVRLNPHFGLQKILYTALNCTFKCRTI